MLCSFFVPVGNSNIVWLHLAIASKADQFWWRHEVLITAVFLSGILYQVFLFTLVSCTYVTFWRRSWCNGYCSRKWTRWHKFKSLWMVCIPLFSRQLWINSRACWSLQHKSSKRCSERTFYSELLNFTRKLNLGSYPARVGGRVRKYIDSSISLAQNHGRDTLVNFNLA